MWSCQKKAMTSWKGRSVSVMIRSHQRDIWYPLGKPPCRAGGSEGFTSSEKAADSMAVPDFMISMSSR